jgi:DNA-binding MarR family transcriptional regulator
MSRLAPRIDLDQFLTYRISVFAAVWGAATGRFYRERFGLALREWRVLAVLSREDGTPGGTPAREIARLTAVDKAGVSRAIASLERRGLLAREGSVEDGRRSGVSLTAAGRALIGRLAPAALARQASLVSVLTRAERRTFLALLRKLEGRAAELANSAPALAPRQDPCRNPRSSGAAARRRRAGPGGGC